MFVQVYEMKIFVLNSVSVLFIIVTVSLYSAIVPSKQLNLVMMMMIMTIKWNFLTLTDSFCDCERFNNWKESEATKTCIPLLLFCFQIKRTHTQKICISWIHVRILVIIFVCLLFYLIYNEFRQKFFVHSKFCLLT